MITRCGACGKRYRVSHTAHRRLQQQQDSGQLLPRNPSPRLNSPGEPWQVWLLGGIHQIYMGRLPTRNSEGPLKRTNLAIMSTKEAVFWQINAISSVGIGPGITHELPGNVDRPGLPHVQHQVKVGHVQYKRDSRSDSTEDQPPTLVSCRYKTGHDLAHTQAVNEFNRRTVK